MGKKKDEIWKKRMWKVNSYFIRGGNRVLFRGRKKYDFVGWGGGINCLEKIGRKVKLGGAGRD